MEGAIPRYSTQCPPQNQFLLPGAPAGMPYGNSSALKNKTRQTGASLKVECSSAGLLLLFFPAAGLFLLCGCRSLLFFHLFADLFLTLAADLCPLGALGFDHLLTAQRSEERRVGKECRSRW